MDKRFIPYMLFALVIIAFAGIKFVPAYAEYFRSVAELLIGAFLGLFVTSPVDE
ncbi:MAG: hypothetical protein WC616_02370 [Candidatus Omnitrophota bacterium]